MKIPAAPFISFIIVGLTAKPGHSRDLRCDPPDGVLRKDHQDT